VAVGRRRLEGRVAVGRARRGRHLDEVRTTGTRAALDEIAGDADVVGRGRPGEVDLGARDGGGREPRGRGGWAGVVRTAPCQLGHRVPAVLEVLELYVVFARSEGLCRLVGRRALIDPRVDEQLSVDPETHPIVRPGAERI